MTATRLRIKTLALLLLTGLLLPVWAHSQDGKGLSFGTGTHETATPHLASYTGKSALQSRLASSSQQPEKRRLVPYAGLKPFEPSQNQNANLRNSPRQNNPIAASWQSFYPRPRTFPALQKPSSIRLCAGWPLQWPIRPPPIQSPV